LQWYTKHPGLKIVFQLQVEPFTVFLANDSGRVMIEIYKNPADEIPPYRKMNPLLLPLAFVSESLESDTNNLPEATLLSDDNLKDGSHKVMMRHPWGLALQFCKRSMIKLTEREPN
jgi:glyoxylase I family protein